MDIDGVIVGTSSPQSDVIDLLHWVIKHHSGSTYWLTTHCQRGANRCIEYLRRHFFPDDLLKEMDVVFKPTDWDVLKTEAIDFSQDFIWLDDSPLQSEMSVLRARDAVEKCIVMDAKNPMMARFALAKLEAIHGIDLQ